MYISSVYSTLPVAIVCTPCINGQCYWTMPTGTGRSGHRIPVGGEIFRTRPDRYWSPPSLLYNGYLAFPGSKAAEAWRWQPSPSSVKVKERVELYFYFSSGPSWLVLRWLYLNVCLLYTYL